MRPSASFRARRLAALACGVGGLLAAGPAFAVEATPQERQLTPEEIDAWLDSRAMPRSQGDHGADDDLEAPPPPPRKKGFVLESSIGVMGQVGHLKHITPNAPWFGLRFGFEPLRWLMVFVESDLFVASTSYAHPPPSPRSFAFWNGGAGFRLTVRPVDYIGVYLQGSAELGLEWYQINPHLALALHGGVRNYPRVLKRDRDSQPPMTWLSGVGLRYTF
jgi:hypothetical protein